MKKAFSTLTFGLLSLLAIAQNQPAGIRLEVAECTINEKEYTIFSYTDKEDGTFSYYLGLGTPDGISETIFVFDQFTETCIGMGTTLDEVQARLDEFLALLNETPGTTREYPARLGVGEGFIHPESTSAKCEVRKKLLWGKRLVFYFKNDAYTTETYLSKSGIKSLRTNLKIYRKLHPKKE